MMLPIKKKTMHAHALSFGVLSLGLLLSGTAQAQNNSSGGEAVIDYSKYGRKGAKARRAWLDYPEKAYDPNTVVYCDALWMRVHAADSPALILKDRKKTMTLEQADREGWRIGESGQSGRTRSSFKGYRRKYPEALISDDAMGIVNQQRGGSDLKWMLAGDHRFVPKQTNLRMTKGAALDLPGGRVGEHTVERGPSLTTISEAGWAALHSGQPYSPPAGWSAKALSPDELPSRADVDVIIEHTLHSGPGIQEILFEDPLATVEHFMTMRFFFPVEQWLHLYKAYRSTGDERLLDTMLESARHYNTLSKDYLSAAQKKASDPEGMAYMYTMAAWSRITLQLALKYPDQVSADEIAEAEDFLQTIISVLEPTCEGNDNLDPQMGIPQPLADDFRDRAFNRAMNGIGTIGMATAALRDLQTLKDTTEYQSTIDRYRKVVMEYIKNWKNTGFEETYQGNDYFSYPYSATDGGNWVGNVKMFGADDQGHFSHTLQGVYLLYDSVPELGVNDDFMTAIANTIHFNSYTSSGSPQTPSQEAIRPYSRKNFSAPRDRFYLLEAFKDGLIDGQNRRLNASSRESKNRAYEYRLETLHIHYLKALREERSLIYLGDAATLSIWADSEVDFLVDEPIDLHADVLVPDFNLVSALWEQVSGPSVASFSDSSAMDPSVIFSETGTYTLRLSISDGATTHSATKTITIKDTIPPAPPTGLVAVAGTSGGISLNWEANTEADFAAHLVYRREAQGSYGEAYASDLLSSNFMDFGAIAGKTYFYRIVALDTSGNASGPGAEASAIAPAPLARTLFGSAQDGLGWFSTGTSEPADTAWSVETSGARFTNNGAGTSGHVNSSLLGPLSMDRTEGNGHALTGVVDLMSTYAADHNRFGISLFAASADVAGIDTGLSLQVNLHTEQMFIRGGVNGGSLASADLVGVEAADLIGETLVFTATVEFVGTDIGIGFTLSVPSLAYTQSVGTTVAAANYTGGNFGFGARGRVRGTDTKDVPFSYEAVSFSIQSSDNGSTNVAPAVNAGADQTIQLSTDPIVLDGTVTDDGLPGGAVSTTWSVTSGDSANVSFADALVAETTATFAAAGTYELTLTADDGELSSADSITVGVTPAIPDGLEVKINFQPAEVPAPAGYLVDAGNAFADRGNGYSYGWDVAVDETRDRNASSDQRYDTLNHMQKATGRTWEIALPNGDYTAYMVMGDPSYTDQVNTVDVEGVRQADPDGQDNFDEYTLSVTVTDGRLTVAPAAGSFNAKMCFIEITGDDMTVTVESEGTSGRKIAYIYGDVAADGAVPSGSDSPFHQMLLTDPGNRGLSIFKSMVETEGHTIQQFYDQDTSLNAAFLDQFDVIIFSLHQKIWSSSEKNALDTWLQAGGGMLIYSDSASGGWWKIVDEGAQNAVGQTVTNNLISQYGMQVTVDQANGIKAVRAGSDSTHPLVSDRIVLEGEGVSPVAVDPNGGAIRLIPYENDPEFVVSGAPSIPHTQNISIQNPQYAALALAEVGDGNIIVMFDRQPMWNNGEGSDIEKRDNEELLRRIVNFLAESDDPTDGDSDGIADAWEIEHFGAVGVVDGSGDADGDGLPDFFEYIFDSNPNDAADHGEPLRATRADDGSGMLIRWTVGPDIIAGTHYDVRFSTNLSEWNPLPTEASLEEITGDPTQIELTLPASVGEKAFIRLRSRIPE